MLSCTEERSEPPPRPAIASDSASRRALTGPAGGRDGPVFEEITAAAGISFRHVFGERERYWLPQEIGSGGALLDYDEDGDLDLYLVQSGALAGPGAGQGNRLYRNDGDDRFVDVTEGSGAGLDAADAPAYGIGCAAADYDRDGDVDLYVTRLGANALLRNDGDGTFSEVTEAAGVGGSSFSAGASFLDYDRDGHLDLFVVNYVDWSAEKEAACYDPRGLPDYCSPIVYEAPAVDRLYRATGRGRFEDVTEAAGISSARGNGLGIAATDFDGDGWVDVFVANDQTPGHLWINQRDGTFREDAALSGCAFNADGMAIAGMGVAAQDLDGDGDRDLLVTNIYNQSHLGLRNDGGLFTDASHLWGLANWSVPFTGFGVGLFDQDLDGSLDGIVVNGAVNRLAEPFRPGNPFAEPNQFLRRDAEGRFYDASVEAGPALAHHEMSRAVLLGDIDDDGDLDVLVTNNRGPARLLRNRNDSGHAWVLLDLASGDGARHAINAQVTVEAGGRIFHRELQPSSGYLGSHDPRIHLGLGAVARIDRLAVRWPDGRRAAWRELPARARLKLGQRTGG